MLTERPSFAIIIFVPSEHAPIAQLDRAFDYESKGHRFESCWVHHEPLTSFALLAVVFYSFVFLGIAWFLKRLSRALASMSEVGVRDFCYSFRILFPSRQTNYHKTYHNNSCSTPDFPCSHIVFLRVEIITNRITST